MKTEHGKIEGDVVVEDAQTLHGVITGNSDSFSRYLLRFLLGKILYLEEPVYVR